MKTFRSSVLAMTVAGAAGTALADANSLNLLFPFDSSNPVGTGWTQSMPRNDDGSSALLDIGFTFCFYETDRTQLHINNNGNVTFTNSYGAFSPSGFPSAAVPAMIAPFWADVDTRNTSLGGIDTNLVWHRTYDTNNDSAPDVFVVTWDSVGYFNQQNNLRNTFQLALAADPDHFGPMLNAAFSYGDMQWTTGSASGGVGGFGGFPATVGLNNGDGVRYSQLGRFDHEGVDYNEQM
ncbi:MAG: nidogen-like domain-containing protein, partial [Phycisphaerales bacterium]